jgi:ADP-ribosylglycohydrolase
MRVAPIGLVADDPFELGLAAAAITHGHPSGYLAAAAFAWIIGRVARGPQLLAAAARAAEIVAPRPNSEETMAALQGALLLASERGEPTPELVETLGGGWIAEEALAIAVYCGLVARDFRHGVLLAVNHSGDSDSTGSMTGNLLGAGLGAGALPPEWRRDLCGKEVVESVAWDLARHFSTDAALAPDDDRYPPW